MDEENDGLPRRFVRRSRLTDEQKAATDAKIAEIKRTRREIWTPGYIDIPDGIQSPENGIPAITFEELLLQDTKYLPRIGNQTDAHTGLSFITKIFSDNTPFLRASFDPYLEVDGRQLVGKNFGIEKALVEDVFLDQNPIDPGLIDVYNISLSELGDPNYIGEVAIYTARNLLVPQDQVLADHINSWVADPEFRKRIEEYSRKAAEVLHLIKLRAAILGPGRTEVISDRTKINERFFVTYDYEGIKEAVEKRGGDGEFTKEDVEWLETHMKAKGLPIHG